MALCAGLLFGLITMLIQYVGLFITGFHTGLLLAIAGLAIYDHFLESRPTTVSKAIVVNTFPMTTPVRKLCYFVAKNIMLCKCSQEVTR